MSSDDSSPLSLFGIGDNRIPARVDLEEDLNLKAVVDRIELGAILLCSLLIGLGLFTGLPITVQVGLAVVAVVLLDLLDRKLVDRVLESG